MATIDVSEPSESGTDVTGAEIDNSYECRVISLAHEPRKHAEFLQRNRETNLCFVLFDASDGRTLDFDECVRDGLIKADAVGFTMGRLGCASSHRSLWTEADRTKCNLLIFEDDVYCRHDIGRQIEKLLSKLQQWDIVLLGYNTNAVLDFRISEHCNFAGFFSNETPSVQQLEAFTKETADPVLMRLNNAFGLCSYLVSPQGACKLLSLFPLDNRSVRIPGNKTRCGREVFRCVTTDMTVNTLYARMNAFVAIPPLALPRNDEHASTTMRDTSPQEAGRVARSSSSTPMERFVHGLKKFGSQKLSALFRKTSGGGHA